MLVQIITIAVSVVLCVLFMAIHVVYAKRYDKINVLKLEKSNAGFTSLLKKYLFFFISLFFLIVVVITALSFAV